MALVFVDFEASSLAKDSFPIEVGWISEDGNGEEHLIRPAPGWHDWDPAAEAIHGITHERLIAEGESHDIVARRMVERLAGSDLCASAPSWDGKWLSALLRAAGLPRHSLRLRDSDDIRAEAARAILEPSLAPDRVEEAVRQVLMDADAEVRGQPAHRALADAREERDRWRAVRAFATQRVG